MKYIQSNTNTDQNHATVRPGVARVRPVSGFDGKTRNFVHTGMGGRTGPRLDKAIVERERLDNGRILLAALLELLERD